MVHERINSFVDNSNISAFSEHCLRMQMQKEGLFYQALASLLIKVEYVDCKPVYWRRFCGEVSVTRSMTHTLEAFSFKSNADVWAFVDS